MHGLCEGTGAHECNADAPRSRSPMVGVVAALVLAAAGAGGFYAFRAISGTGSTGSVPIEEAGLAAGDEAVTPGALDSTTPVAEDPVAAVPAPAPVVLVLAVTSNPPGAAVRLDDVDTGETTPASFELEEPYPQTVGLTLAGYRPLSREIPPVEGDAVEGDAVEVPFGELTRTLGRIGLLDDYPFEVWIGDRQWRELGDAREITGWPTGSVPVRIRNPEYFLDQSFTLEVVEDGRVELIAPALGSFTVFSDPCNCEILIGAQNIGFPPVNERPAAPATYRVSRRCLDERENREQPVTVVSNQDERVTFAPVQR